MSRRTDSRWLVGLAVFAVALAGYALGMHVRPAVAQNVEIDSDDIGGIVTGPSGPEGGGWVIAETHELGTRYIKTVVTDDRGRYVLPICRRHITMSGCVVTAWWTRP